MTKWGRLLTNSPVLLVLQTNAACVRICFDVCTQSLTAVESTDSILLFFFRAYQEVLGGVLLYTLMMFSPVAASQMMFVVLTLRISVM